MSDSERDHRGSAAAVRVEDTPSVADFPPGASRGEDGRRSRAELAAHLAALMQRCARGNASAFAELYDRTSARIYGVILRVIRSRDLADEVTQDVYLEIWRQATQYSPAKGSVLAWMTTVAHRRAVDRVRSESSDSARNLRYAQFNGDRESDEVWDDVSQHLDSDRVRTALSTLTAIQREALVLAYFGGYTHVQVAERLELPLGTAKTRIRDGLIGLRNALEVGALGGER